MASVLVYSHFCPNQATTGGVQVVVRPLLRELSVLGWDVGVVHPSECDDTEHFIIQNPRVRWTEFVDPALLSENARQLAAMSSAFDVILSVDRVLPDLPRPTVLMSNSLAYVEESNAVLSQRWDAVVVPSRSHGQACFDIAGGLPPVVIPYGLDDADLESLGSIADSHTRRRPQNLLLPHRADRRKGHMVVLEGLRSHPDLRTRICWLDNEHDRAFRIELDTYVERWALSDRVEFVSWKGDAERFVNLAWADVVLQVGTFVETFGLSLVEAVLAGRLGLSGPQPAVRSVLAGNPSYLELDRTDSWPEKMHHFAQGAVDPEAATMDLSISRMATDYDQLLGRHI